jgi:hypothetical protein
MCGSRSKLREEVGPVSAVHDEVTAEAPGPLALDVLDLVGLAHEEVAAEVSRADVDADTRHVWLDTRDLNAEAGEGESGHHAAKD